MRVQMKTIGFAVLLAAGLAESCFAQKALTWQEVRDKFEAANPTLRAGQIGIDESRAEEITAYLRPNPPLALLADQIDPFTEARSHSSFGLLADSATVNYLHERQHKRELRLESAQKATGIAVSGQADLERTLLFSLRSAFVGTLQAKAVLRVAKDNLDYWDQVLDISRDALTSGGHRANRSGPPGAAARAIRIRRADRGGQSANRKDSAADAVERPDAGRAVRRTGLFEFQRATPAAR